MTPPRFRKTLLIVALVCTGVLPACGKRKPALAGGPPPPPPAEDESASTARGRGSLEEGPDIRAVEGEAASGTDFSSTGSGIEEDSPLADIHFDYDSSALSDATRSTLEAHALWLQGHRTVRVTVEGHCDERGTTEYNLALGDQRARAVHDYLVGLGVAATRLRVVSYGKERPLDPSSSEEAYAKNRRAHFAVSR